MAGLLPGDPSHHGMAEGGGSFSFSQDKPDEAGRWYLSRKEIEENSPSRRDGIDLKKETYLRKSYCTFLQDLGMRLKVPQVTIATAIIFCHRFFLRQSHAKNDRRTIATVCMFLAGKVEETPRPLKDVILVSYEIIHKKDPAAVQRIKQKEVYEQQKELILIGERVVLATLGFDLNVHHPYKPLVEAIKKFKVAQNALAQVAWNFVNDGLRTSLCLQFKPHHIAAGAIFLAAKFLKVKLPSDGEKVWWQEFDVTPRQLEEVSNQMLELYEQNRVPPPQGSEVEGSTTIAGSSHRSIAKPLISNDEPVTSNGFTQAGGASNMKAGTTLPPTRSASDHSYADNQGTSQRGLNRSNEYGSTETRPVLSDHRVDGENKERRHSESESYNRENVAETSNRSRFVSERHMEEDRERNNGRSDSIKTGESKNEGVPYKLSSSGGRHTEYRDGPLGQSPQDAIKRIDRDKLKAALEKRKKSRGDIAKKTDLMDDDDLIERELEDGVELAAEDEKNKRERERERERRQSWSKSSNRVEPENPNYGNDVEDAGDRRHHHAWGQEGEVVEEGEVSLFEEADQGFRSPKVSNRKRKASSPDKHGSEGKLRNDYMASGYDGYS